MVSLAFHSSSSHAHVAPAPRPSLAKRLTSVWHGLANEWQVRRTIWALEALDSHVLLDMGITRGGIEDAVRHGR